MKPTIQDFVESEMSARDFLESVDLYDLDEMQVSGDFNIAPGVGIMRKGEVSVVAPSKEYDDEDAWLYRGKTKEQTKTESKKLGLTEEDSILGNLDIGGLGKGGLGKGGSPSRGGNLAEAYLSGGVSTDDSLPDTLKGLF